MPVTRENLHDVMHPADGCLETSVRAQIIRGATEEFIAVILANTPTCGDQQAAIRHAREAGVTAEWAIRLKGAV